MALNMAVGLLGIYSLALALVFVSAHAASPQQKLKAMRTLREVNRKGPYIGLVTVFSPEEDAFFTAADFRPNPRHPFVDLSGRRFRVGTVHGKKVIYVKCGVGLVNAAAATQQMLDLFNIEGIIHFGIAGNVNDSMSIGDVTIPKQVANTGLWNWVNPNGTISADDVAELKIANYNVPKEENGSNILGSIGYSPEEHYSKSGQLGTPKSLLWADVTPHWLELATTLEGIELSQCVNSSLCLPERPKAVVGLKASASDAFLDNAAYRDFIFQTFEVSSADMESSAVVMTCLSNGYPVIVIRGLSDLAGAQDGANAMRTFGSLAALNTAKAVVQFIDRLPCKDGSLAY